MPKSVDIFFPMYFGDYLKSTQMLTCEEHGAYFLLIGALWQNRGYLPFNIKKLSLICKLNQNEFEVVWKEIESFFIIEDDKISQKRVLEELEKARERSERAQLNGSKGGRPKKPTRLPTGVPTGVPRDKPKHNPEKSSSHTHTHSINNNGVKRFSPPPLKEIKDFIIEKKYPVNPESFFHFYESKNWMVGKNKMKNWKSSIVTWANKPSADGINFIEPYKRKPKTDHLKATINFDKEKLF